jgi:hypothetical protein
MKKFILQQGTTKVRKMGGLNINYKLYQMTKGRLVYIGEDDICTSAWGGEKATATRILKDAGIIKNKKVNSYGDGYFTDTYTIGNRGLSNTYEKTTQKATLQVLSY